MTQIDVICKNKDFIFAIFKILLPHLKGLNNSGNLIIISLITNFHKNYFLKKKKITKYYWFGSSKVI